MKIYVSLILLVVFQIAAAGSIVTVGADADIGCDYHSIQSAINDVNASEIRVANNKTYTENLSIVGGNKKILGGFGNCTEAVLGISNLSQALVTGNGAVPVVNVNVGTPGVHNIELKRLRVGNGTDGVSIVAQNGAELSVLVSGLQMFNNSQNGLNVLSNTNGLADVILNDVTVNFNNDSGVDCSGSNTNVRVAGESEISDNDAPSGGGMFVHDGCTMNVYSPVQIKNNSANTSGGGVNVSNAIFNAIGVYAYCENGICFGDDSEPVVISGNDGDADDNLNGSGGAIIASGQSTEVTMNNTRITNNHAFIGGGMYVVGGAKLSLAGYEEPVQSCWNPSACVEIKNNTANTGGGFYAAGANSEITIHAAHFTNNRSNNGAAGVVSGEATALVSASVVYGNGLLNDAVYSNNSLFRLSGGIDFSPGLTLNAVSIADNHLTGVVFNNNRGDLDVSSSIVFDTHNVYQETGNNATQQFECVIAHEKTSFLGDGTVSVVNPLNTPVFINPQQGDYHLVFNSPAIDYCHKTENEVLTDIDYDQRGIDDPDNVDLFGLYDIGADEFNDLIFRDDFE